MNDSTDDVYRVLGALPDYVVVVQADGALTWTNEAWGTTFGTAAAARTLSSWVHPGDAAELADIVSEHGEVSTFRGRFRSRDGTWIWLAWSIRWCEGSGVATARDVSDTVELEHDLRDNLRLWDLAAEASRLGYWVIDLRTQRVYWSPEIYRIHGLTPANHTPSVEHGIDAYHPEDREMVGRFVTLAIEEGKPFDFELRLVQPDGAVRTVMSSGRAHLGPDGEIVRVIGIFRDVTEERIRSERAAQAEILAISNAHLERFAWSVSHDLKAPLRGIRMCADWIAADPGITQSADTIENLGFIQSRVGRLERMIDGVLQLSTLAGRRSPWVAVDLSSMVTEITTVLSQPITAGPLPTVFGDPVQVERVLQNLLSNAFTHGATRVEVHEVSPGCIAIDDDGPGIPAKHREVLFDLFRTLVPRDDTDGSGVGLSIVKVLMEQLDGRVSVADSPLGGARFCLHFPESPSKKTPLAEVRVVEPSKEAT